MNDSDPEGLRGAWGRDYATAWAPKFAAVLSAIDSTPVNVLLWGPGVSSPEYAKRQEIGAALGDERTSVMTSEAIMDADPHFGEIGDTMVAEGIQAEAADVVIALAVDSRDVTGVHAELTKFGDHPRTGPKIRLLAPIRPRGAGRPLILEAADMVPEARRFDYSDAQYQDCQEIRARARRWVAEVRREKFLRLVRDGTIRPD